MEIPARGLCRSSGRSWGSLARRGLYLRLYRYHGTEYFHRRGFAQARLYGLYVAPHGGGGGGGKELPHALYYDDLMTKPSLINSLSSWWRHRFFDKH